MRWQYVCNISLLQLQNPVRLEELHNTLSSFYRTISVEGLARLRVLWCNFVTVYHPAAPRGSCVSSVLFLFCNYFFFLVSGNSPDLYVLVRTLVIKVRLVLS